MRISLTSPKGTTSIETPPVDMIGFCRCDHGGRGGIAVSGSGGNGSLKGMILVYTVDVGTVARFFVVYNLASPWPKGRIRIHALRCKEWTYAWV